MTTLTSQPQRASTVANHATLSFAGTVRSEWIKFRSLRSTFWSYALVIVIAIGMSALIAFALTGTSEGTAAIGESAGSTDPVVNAALVGVGFAQLVAGVLGVLVISGEYSTGMIRSTFAAVPARIPALAAKGIVLFVATFVVGLVANLAGYLTASLVFAQEDISAPLTDPGVFWPMLGAALSLALVALFALGVGAIVRSSPGGIAVVLGVILLLPTVLQLIPAEWAREVIPYLFSSAGTGIFTSTSLKPVGDALGVWLNLLIAGVWVAVSVVTAAVLMRRRDG